MGLYIQSENKGKWCEDNAILIKHGTGKVINLDNYADTIDEERERIICLVDNGQFSALGVGFDKREVEHFNQESDNRFKIFYRCPLETLKAVCPNYAEYIKE
tara:strand:+ start:5917 stop:6222 length:306 start_codon:yes stop_codon:yes gene_type:complete